MKKIGLIMMPLLALAALTNCNKSNPKLDPLNTPLCFTCLSDSATITIAPFSKLSEPNQKSYINFPNLEYSYNGKTNWELISSDFDYDHLPTFTLEKEQTLYFRGDNPNGIDSGAMFISKVDESKKIIHDGDLELKGNIMSLVSKKGFAELTIVPTGSFGGAFVYLFNENQNIIDASELLLPTELSPHCYDSMFRFCHYLTKAPELGATKMYKSCYANMFEYCSALESAPILPAADSGLAEKCYYNMFCECEKLKNVQVGFGASSTWPTLKECTQFWLLRVSDSGTFKWKGNDTVTRGSDYVPEGWTIETI